jgi:hypothetical protein
MISKRAFLALSFASSFLAVPVQAAKDTELLEAIQKLKDAGSYTWRTELRISPGPTAPMVTEGWYSATQGLYVKVRSEKHSVELAVRSGVVVARTGDEWRPVKKFTRSDLDHSMIRGLADLKLPHLDLAQIQDSWRSSRKNTADQFGGQVGLNAARKLVDLLIQQAGARLGNHSIAQSNASVILSGGLPSRYVLESRFSGPPGLLSSGQGMQVVLITQFSNVGSTTVTLPTAAEAAIIAEQTR